MQILDLFWLAIKGLAVASVPLAFVWTARGGPEKLQRLAWVTVFFTFDLIVFGGFTRLTDSGLGCPDWPGCYAKSNPFSALADIRAAEAVLPDGPVTLAKAWIEMLHRYLAMGVGFMIIVMVILAWQARHRLTTARPGFALGLLVLVCLQGAFGAWTVTLKLQPIIVTMHLLLGLLLLALLTAYASGFELRRLSRTPSVALRAWAMGAGLVLIVQIALGGWVSTNYAVLACSDFPLCQGEWIPHMDFEQGFYPWRSLGQTADGGFLPFAALTAIHWTHRNFAWLVFVILGVFALQAMRYVDLRRTAIILMTLLVTQFITGISNVIFDWPLLAAVLHNAGAAALVAVLVVLNYRINWCSPVASHAVIALRSRPHATST